MNASELMTAPALTIPSDATIEDAVRLMVDKHVSGLPVVDRNGALVGVLTEGDLLRRSEFGTGRKRARWLEFLLGPGVEAADYVRENARRVVEVMTDTPVSIDETASAADIVDLMEKRHIKRLPVVRDGRIVGVVSRADVIRGLASRKLTAAPASDKDVRARVLETLRQQKWAPVGLISVHVDHGEVTLEGAIMDERERTALRVACENTPGVAKVHDRLVWVGPEGLYVEPPKE